MDVIVIFPPEPPDAYLVWSFDKFGFVVCLEI